jgi:hypothetical protein
MLMYPHIMKVVAVSCHQVKCWQSADVLEQAWSTCSSWATCSMLYSVMFPTEIFEMRKVFWPFPRQNQDRTHYQSWKLMGCLLMETYIKLVNSVCKNVLKIMTPYRMLWTAFFISLSYYYIFMAHDVWKHTQVKLYICLFCPCSVYWIPCCLHADQIWPKLPALYRVEQSCFRRRSPHFQIVKVV